MRLWTAQLTPNVRRLRADGELVAELPGWKLWDPPYTWMVEAMAARGVVCTGTAPVWAWHSCAGWQLPPDDAFLDDLFGAGWAVGSVLELDAPDASCVLSRYDAWNELIDRLANGSIPDELVQRLFELPTPHDVGHEWRWTEIQATLPRLDAAWVAGERVFDLRSDAADATDR